MRKPPLKCTSSEKSSKIFSQLTPLPKPISKSRKTTTNAVIQKYVRNVCTVTLWQNWYVTVQNFPLKNFDERYLKYETNANRAGNEEGKGVMMKMKRDKNFQREWQNEHCHLLTAPLRLLGSTTLPLPFHNPLITVANALINDPCKDEEFVNQLDKILTYLPSSTSCWCWSHASVRRSEGSSSAA